jgi:hypothetical protein
MCPKNTYVLRISNRGEGVQNTAFGTKTIQVDGEDVDIQIPISWTMNLPACLRSKGPCNVTVTYAAMETIENYTVLAINSNIPQLGADTEQGLNSSAATRLATLTPNRDKPASDAQEIYRQQAPHTFRCTGLPERLEFTRVCLIESGANTLAGHIPTPNANPSTNPVVAANSYYAEVCMTVEFDSY